MNEEIKHLLMYLQNLIDSGTYKIFYDDLFSDEKVIDIMNAIINLQKEIERLNNIINEFEEWIMEDVKDEKPDLYFQVLRKIDILEKLKELKGDDKDGIK